MIKCRSPFDGCAKVSRNSISDTSSVLSKRRQSPLREFRWTRGVCLDVCRNAASASKNFLAFAATLQVLRKTFWPLQECCKRLEKLFGLCRNAASAPRNFLAFAGTLQVPRKTFWRLQKCCKCPEKLFGLCRNAANASRNFLAFATLLQVSRKTFWCLQHCCKSHEKLFGVCNTVASLTKNFLAFATLLQVPRKTFWRLQHCCKHFRKRLDHLVAPVETLCGLYSDVEPPRVIIRLVNIRIYVMLRIGRLEEVGVTLPSKSRHGYDGNGKDEQRRFGDAS